MLRLAAFLVNLLAAASAPAQAPLPPPAPLKAGAPSLVVVISVDQFSADLFDEYRPHFTGGLARLCERDGVPQRLSGPRGHGDLPGPFDDPDRFAPDAHGHHRQYLGRPVGLPLRQDSLLLRG